MKILNRFLVVGITLSAATRLTAASLIANGGFETGSFSSWTTTSAASGSQFGVSTTGPHTGTFAAYFSATGSDLDRIDQTFATTAGTLYDLTFWLANDNGGGSPDNGFVVNFGGISFAFGGAADFAYQQFTFSSLATGSSITLDIAGRNASGALLLDDVSVTSRASVPDEGSTFGLLFLSLAAFFGAARFRSQPVT
jgi:hypothetical protein